MTQNNYVTNSIQAFSLAALVFGVFSVLSFFTGIIPLFTGCMSLLFVALSYRKGSPLTGAAHAAIYLSLIGMILGIALLVYVLLPMMNDPEYYNAMDLYYRNNLGVSLDELLDGAFKPVNQ